MFQTEIDTLHFCKDRVLLAQKIKKNREIICIGNAGTGGGARLNAAEKIGAECRKLLCHFPQLFNIFNILLFVIRQIRHGL